MEQFLLFRLGDDLYGLEVASLQEVVEAPPIYYVPLAPPCFCGAINWHGQILPVLDLPGYLGIAGERRDRRIVVLAGTVCALAFTATAVQRIVSCAPEMRRPLSAGENLPFIHSLCDREGETIRILDAVALVAGLDAHEQRRK